MASTFVQLVTHLLNPQYVGVGIVSALLLASVVRFYNDPLRHIPGPLIARLTPCWLWYISWRGTESRAISALHKRYGPVVRIAPNEVDINDGAAIHQIYVKNGGLAKSPTYQNVNVDGFSTIFSAVDPAQRAMRVKAVAPMFAQQAVVKGKPTAMKIVNAMLEELSRRKAAANGGPVDVLNLFRALALDTASTYLFGESFNGLGQGRLEATAYVDDFTANFRFFHLPGWIYGQVSYWAAIYNDARVQVAASYNIVEEFAARVVDKSIAEEKGEPKTYQGRLLKAGTSREETIAQVKDVMYAGTDATGMVISVLCFYLGRCYDKYERVRKEVLENPDADAQSLPYLSGIVKESLRLSMVNPIRLPRVVSSGGLEVADLALPAGTRVGLGAYMLHHNPGVFPNPREFLPERWLEPSPNMMRDSFSFGAGSRQCIARNLASAEIWWTAEALIRSGVLEGLKSVQDKIETREWFNASVIDGKIELIWQ
ncbi:cytochrome P450 [Hypoxylon crocopeplum]|nr:cytochrome P450 [Hypoxylon crocopeplum]